MGEKSLTIKVAVRIVATTNGNLDEEVRKGRFRQDLHKLGIIRPETKKSGS